MGDVALSVISLPETTPPGAGARVQRGVSSPRGFPQPLSLMFTPRSCHTAPLARDAGDYTDNATSRMSLAIAQQFLMV
jgi:hypothetical protein